VSTEYYTGLPFEKTKERLRRALGDGFVFEYPEKSRYIPECCAFLLCHVESGKAIWCLKEIRELHHLPHAGVMPPIGTLTFESFGRAKPELFLPWIEKTLGIRVMSEIGLPWELDV
jgi:hypothetical protein